MVSFEFEIPVEAFGVEAEAIIGGAVGNVESMNSLEPVILWMDETNFADNYFSAGFGTKGERLAVAENTARKSRVDVDWLM